MDENNENKYVSRVPRARVATRYVCYTEIDFAKDGNVFRRTGLPGDRRGGEGGGQSDVER